jgi:hypothetical protein
MALGKPSVVKGKTGSGSRDRKPISVAPSDAMAGGGAPDNVDATIISMEATTWDYDKNIGPFPFLAVGFRFDDGSEMVQKYKAGDLAKIVPADDGSCFYPAEGSSASGLPDNCNALMFLGYLVDHGFPEEKLRQDGFGSAVGLYGHLNAVAPKGRENLEGGKQPQSVFTKVHRMPWETKGKGASGGTTKSPSTARTITAANGAGDDLNAEAIEAVVAALDKANGPIEVKRLGMLAFQAAPKATHRKELIKYVTTNDFLEQSDLPFAVDGEHVVMI